MSSPAPGQPIADRADIHKSCISIETLLNVLNEYCEAAGAVVALQKKLAKALRESAGQKVVGEISANAMNASASIFEALSEVDSKFSKIADKEYDVVSTEVKKWFKKLAKEEKLHDERIASANAKIKQAGLTYEKKSKKKSTDAGDEHAKYINLISTLGPEVSQEKYNHALNVMQKHVTTTFSVAACLSRLADFEWQKSCESVRRFSPTIGPLGQWRVLCEGGWNNPLPPDLPDLNSSNEHSNAPKESLPKAIEEETRQPVRLTPEPNEATTKHPRHLPLVYSAGPPSASESSNELLRDHPPSPALARQQPPATDANTSPDLGGVKAPPQRLEPPRTPYEDAVTGSVRSLSAFPSPPNHFPLPPPRSQQSSYFQSTASGSSNLDLPSHSQLAESPVSGPEDGPGANYLDERAPPRGSHEPLNSQTGSSPRIGVEEEYREQSRVQEDKVIHDRPTELEIRGPKPVRAQSSLPPESSYRTDQEMPVLRDGQHRPSSSNDFRYLNQALHSPDDRLEEFGVLNRNTEASRTESSKYPKVLERTMTGESNGSVVAAMRNRYSNNPGSISPPPKDIPRLPLSVNDLATRYQPTDGMISPRLRTTSPPVLRQQSLPAIDMSARQVKETYLDRISAQSLSHQEQDRRRDYGKSDEIDRRAKEQSLRERERELELRARELERERARLHTLIEDDGGKYHEGSPAQSQTSQFGLRPRERRTSLRHQLQRPLSQMELDDANEPVRKVNPSTAVSNHSSRLQSRQSNDATHLLPPLNTGKDTPSIPITQPLYSPKIGRSRDLYPDKRNGSSTNVNTSATPEHAPYCGCESCSVSKYKHSGASSVQQPPDPRSQQGQRTDKPSKPGGSWIRRLSMPVGNAFNLDSKRAQNNSNSSSIYSLGNGIGNTPANHSRTRLFSMDGKKNASTTALLASSMTTPGSQGLAVREDGRLRHERRSLETNKTSNNRSVTNLGLLTKDGAYKIP